MEEALLAPAESARFERRVLVPAAAVSTVVQTAILDFTRIFTTLSSEFKILPKANDLPPLFGTACSAYGDTHAEMIPPKGADRRPAPPPRSVIPACKAPSQKADNRRH